MTLLYQNYPCEAFDGDFTLLRIGNWFAEREETCPGGNIF